MESFGQLWMCLSLWPRSQGGLHPIFFGPSKRLTLLASSSSSLSLSALNLVGASDELAASSRFCATDFFCYNVGAALLHPGTGGHRLEALSMSDPSNSVAASPDITGVTSSVSSESTSRPSPSTRVAFFLPLGAAAQELVDELCQRACDHKSSCREPWRRQHPAESSHA